MPRTPKLTDLQLILLSTAAARDAGNVFPLNDSIAGKTAEVAKAIMPLLKRALVVEQPETVLVRVWREDTAGRIGLKITDAGRALVDGTLVDPAADVGAKTTLGNATASVSPAPPRAGSKIEQVLALLRQPAGATLAELVAATGWLPHTTRAALTGLRKKGHDVERTRRDGVTCYRIASIA